MILRPRRQWLTVSRPPLVMPGDRRNFVGVARAVVTSGGAGPIPFEILNAGQAGAGSTGTPANGAWTTPAGTTLLLIIFMLGKNTPAPDTITGITFNGDACVEIGGSNDPRLAQPGTSWWYRKNPGIGTSLALGWSIEGAAWAVDSYWTIQAVTFRGEATTPIGATDFPNTSSANATTRSSSITTTAAESIVISAGSWQGDDAAPMTALNSFTKLNDATSGGGSGSLDGANAIGWKSVATPGATAYGWNAASPVTDGGSVGAVEIKKAA